MESNNGDSYRYYVENIGDKEVFFKEYKKWHITKTTLEIYHTLHHHLAKKEKEVYFNDIVVDGRRIERRKIKILDLDPEWIYETNNIETKKDILITTPIYISWKTLKDYEDQVWEKTIQNICDAIGRYIETISKVSFGDMYGVAPINVKIHIKDHTAELIVTDMSCNIKNFFYSGKNAVILNNLFNQSK